MGQPFARIEFSEKTADYRRLASAPGFPVLDRSNVNDKVVARWLGRYAAAAECVGDAVNFYVRNESGNRLDGIACQPASTSDLKGALRKEFAALNSALDGAEPRSKSEQLIRKVLQEKLQDIASSASGCDPSSQFFKYEDERGRQRLVWCWGFQRSRSQDFGSALCASCRLLFIKTPDRNDKCPGCGTALPVKRFPWVKVAVTLLLLVTILSTAGLGYWYIQPRGVLNGTVFRAIDGKPLGEVTVRVADSDLQTKSVGDGTFRLDKLPKGMLKIEVRADGYRDESLDYDFGAGGIVSENFELFGDAIISGRVVNDAGDQPLSDVQIQIVDSPWSTQTNDKGEFRLEGVPSGNTKVRATAFGFPEDVTALIAAPNEPTDLLIRLAGDARFVGQILDERSGSPIAGAQVTITESSLETVADAKGWFAFKQAPSGPVKVAVAAKGYKSREVSRELIANEERSMRILLAGAGTVVGRVVLAEGQTPLSGADVRIAETQFQTTSKSDGEFKLDGVSALPVRIEVAAPGYVPRTVDVDVLEDKETHVHVELRGRAMLSGKVLDVDTAKPIPSASIFIQGTSYKAQTNVDGEFRLEDVPSLPVNIEVAAKGYKSVVVNQKLEPGKEGRLEIPLGGNGVVDGKVIDAVANSPVAGARVAIDGTTRVAETVDDGTFRIEGLRGEKVRVLITAPGFEDQVLDQPLVSDAVTSVMVQLKGDAAVEGVVVDLYKENPLPMVKIKLEDSMFSTSTDAEGRFRIDGLQAGNQKFVATLKGFQTKTVDVRLESGKPVKTRIELGGEATVTGDVTDGTTGKPIGKAEVSLANSSLSTQSSAEGRFKLDGLLGGEAEILFTAPGYFPQTSKQNVASKGETEVHLQLIGAGEAEGRIVDGEGRGVAGANVTMIGSGHTAISDEEGAFRMTKCPTGPAELQITAAGYETALIRQVLAIDGRTNLPSVKLTSNTNYGGFVINAVDGQPIPGVRVNVDGTDITTVSDNTGRFVLNQVPIRKIDMTFVAEGYNSEKASTDPSLAKSPVEVVLNPLVAQGEIRFVLTWDASTPDLDAHLYGMESKPQPRKFHVFHNQRESDTAILNVDNRNGRGPETITIKKSLPGRYEFWVHLHQDSKASEKAPLDFSKLNAMVRVFVFGKEPEAIKLADTPLPARQHSVWHPCGVLVDAAGKIRVISYQSSQFKDNLPPE
jgi:hypothetical protein